MASVSNNGWREPAVKETVTPTAGQRKQRASCSLAEHTSDQSVLRRTIGWICRFLSLKAADAPGAHGVRKSKSPGWHLVNILLCLVIVGPNLAAPFLETQTAWAAPAHLAHQHAVAAHLTP